MRLRKNPGDQQPDKKAGEQQQEEPTGRPVVSRAISKHLCSVDHIALL